MVCNRCILVVRNELDKLGIEANNIKLGEITLKKDLTTKEREALENFQEAFHRLATEGVAAKRDSPESDLGRRFRVSAGARA